MKVAIERFLPWVAAANTVSLTTNSLTGVRNVSLGLGLLMLLVYALSRKDKSSERAAGGAVSTLRLAPPPWSMILIITLWAGWSVASVAWSVRPGFSALQLKHLILFPLVTFAVFYAAAQCENGWRIVIATLLCAVTFMAALALSIFVFSGHWDAGRWHAGVGGFSTVLALAFPFLACLLLPPPVGLRKRPLLAFAAAVAVLGAALLTENRVVWLSLAVSLLALIGIYKLASRRGRSLTRNAKWAIALTLASFILLFAVSVWERAETNWPKETPVLQTLAQDPHFLVWSAAKDRIEESVWLGHGLGKNILEDELRAELGNPTLGHPHNIILSCWLQLGVIGVGAMLALFGAFAWQYARFCGNDRPAVQVVGALGMAMLIGFLMKNMTDDFFVPNTGNLLWALCGAVCGFGRTLSARLVSLQLNPPGLSLIAPTIAPQVREAD